VVQRVHEIDITELRERLNLRASTRGVREQPPLFSAVNLDPHYRPLRALLWSIALHGAICAALVFIPVIVGIVETESLADDAVVLRLEEFDVLYLPVLGNDELPAAAASTAKNETSKTATRPKEGLSYPGPQSIFSDPPNATNHTQTLLQPTLINPAILQSLTLPNIVKMSETPRPVAPVVESKFRSVESSAPVAVSSMPLARLDVPLTSALRAPVAPIVESRLKMVDSIVPVAALPIAPSRLEVALNSTIAAPAPPAPPKPAESTERKPNSNQDLLALSPTPARADQPVVIPAGEMRGRFAISPNPNLAFPGTEPGTNGDAKGNENPSSSANTPAPGAPDNASKPPATAPNSDSGTNPGRGPSAFDGITILGGINGPGSLPRTTPEPIQTSYGITILSSGGSGGGLRDYGVFGNEQVQTVYLDMRRTLNEKPISWTAEYAVGQKDVTPSNGILNISIRQEVLLPFPITKERPEWPEELARKYSGRMVIAFALITTDGKITQLRIKESPDPLLNTAVVTALEKWTFRPARRDGEVAPAKILLGIPVSRSE
jgi:TonB family protein